MDVLLWGTAPALAAVAVLYASVGHGGASGYLAVLALAGLAPQELRPAALSLNLVVSLVATFRFASAGHLRVRLLVPFVAASAPAAFLGGTLPVRPELYNVLLGLVLLLAGGRLAWEGMRGDGREDGPGGRIAVKGTRSDGRKEGPGGRIAEKGTRGEGREDGRPAGKRAAAPSLPALPVMLVAGITIGLASGVIGVGGGIFLSPLVLLMGWASARETAAVSAPFIFVNSASGLTGQLTAGAALPEGLPVWLGAVLAGGWLGATFGSRRARPGTLRLLLGCVLLIAAAKLLLT